MQFRPMLLSSTLAFASAVAQNAHALIEDLSISNNSIATAQNVFSFYEDGVLNVFGLRGIAYFAGQTIVDNNDADFYRFYMKAPQLVTLRVDSPEGPFFNNDPIVGLFSSDGDLLASNSDGGPGLDSLLSYQISTPGLYFAAVSGYPDVDFDGVSDVQYPDDHRPSTNFLYELQISIPTPAPIPSGSWLMASALIVGSAHLRRKNQSPSRTSAADA